MLNNYIRVTPADIVSVPSIVSLRAKWDIDTNISGDDMFVQVVIHVDTLDKETHSFRINVYKLDFEVTLEQSGVTIRELSSKESLGSLGVVLHKLINSESFLESSGTIEERVVDWLNTSGEMERLTELVEKIIPELFEVNTVVDV